MITEAQFETIDVFHENCVEKVPQLFDKRFKEDDLALEPGTHLLILSEKKNRILTNL